MSVLPNAGVRRRPPWRRECMTVAASLDDVQTVSVSVGLYGDDQSPAEVFLKSDAREGTHLAGICDDVGILLSLALQHGVAAATIAASLGRDYDGDRTSIVGVAIDAAIGESARAVAARGQGRSS